MLDPRFLTLKAISVAQAIDNRETRSCCVEFMVNRHAPTDLIITNPQGERLYAQSHASFPNFGEGALGDAKDLKSWFSQMLVQIRNRANLAWKHLYFEGKREVQGTIRAELERFNSDRPLDEQLQLTFKSPDIDHWRSEAELAHARNTLNEIELWLEEEDLEQAPTPRHAAPRIAAPA